MVLTTYLQNYCDSASKFWICTGTVKACQSIGQIKEGVFLPRYFSRFRGGFATEEAHGTCDAIQDCLHREELNGTILHIYSGSFLISPALERSIRRSALRTFLYAAFSFRMCPSENSNILLFLQPPQSYWTTHVPDPINRTNTRYEMKQTGDSKLVRVPLVRLRSPTGRYLRSMEQRYPELVTIRPKLLQEYPRHSILFGRKLLMKEEAAVIKNPFSVISDSEFAYGATFTVNNYIKGRKKRACHSPSIQQPQPQQHHITKAAIRRFEAMASQKDSKLATKTRTYSFDLASQDAGPDEKRNAVYKAILKNHEHAIDDSEDEDDEGGIPAWVAMRRAHYAKRIDGQGQDLSGQPIGDTRPQTYKSVTVRVDPVDEDELQGEIFSLLAILLLTQDRHHGQRERYRGQKE